MQESYRSSLQEALYALHTFSTALQNAEGE